jgi:CcmD family protein
MRRYNWLLVLLAFGSLAHAQVDSIVEGAAEVLSDSAIDAQEFVDTPINTFFYSNQKIFVVVFVLLVIFIGISTYLFRLDKKISQLEKDRNEA